MTVAGRLSSWVPDRPPTTAERRSVATAPVVFAAFAFELDYSLPAVLAGFVLTVVVLGPLAESRVGAWVRRRQPLVRGVAGVLGAVGLLLALMVALSNGIVSPDISMSVCAGSALAFLCFVAIQTLAAREDGAVTETA